MQQAEGLFPFYFSVPVGLYENLIVSLVNVCHFLRIRLPLIMLCTETIYSLSASIKTLYAVVLASYSRSFSPRKIISQEIYVILAKFAPQGSKNRKIVIRAKILLEFTSLIQ